VKTTGTIFPPFFSFKSEIDHTGAEKASILFNEIQAFPFLLERLSTEASVNPDMKSCYFIRYQMLDLRGFGKLQSFSAKASIGKN